MQCWSTSLYGWSGAPGDFVYFLRNRFGKQLVSMKSQERCAIYDTTYKPVDWGHCDFFASFLILPRGGWSTHSIPRQIFRVHWRRHLSCCSARRFSSKPATESHSENGSQQFAP